MLRAADLGGTPLYPVLITAGDHTSQERGIWHVPKRALVGQLQVCLQSERLKVAATLPEAATLTRELLNFKIKITAPHPKFCCLRLVTAGANPNWVKESLAGGKDYDLKIN